MVILTLVPSTLLASYSYVIQQSWPGLQGGTGRLMHNAKAVEIGPVKARVAASSVETVDRLAPRCLVCAEQPPAVSSRRY